MRQTKALVSCVTFALLVSGPLAADSVGDLNDDLDCAELEVTNLTVKQVDGIVLLQGNTLDPSDVATATRITRAHGFKRIANLIRVTVPQDDRAIEREVERQLARSRGLEGCRFRIESDHGVLTLQGTVQRELQKDAARAIVMSVKGVSRCRSELRRG